MTSSDKRWVWSIISPQHPKLKSTSHPQKTMSLIRERADKTWHGVTRHPRRKCGKFQSDAHKAIQKRSQERFWEHKLVDAQTCRTAIFGSKSFPGPFGNSLREYHWWAGERWESACHLTVSLSICFLMKSHWQGRGGRNDQWKFAGTAFPQGFHKVKSVWNKQSSAFCCENLFLLFSDVLTPHSQLIFREWLCSIVLSCTHHLHLLTHTETHHIHKARPNYFVTHSSHSWKILTQLKIYFEGNYWCFIQIIVHIISKNNVVICFLLQFNFAKNRKCLLTV